MENKKTFFDRLEPYLSPKDMLTTKTAYMFSKFAHRHDVRKEADENGKSIRYFEHPRRVCLILMDELKIFEPDLIQTALLHDVLEDFEDADDELLAHLFGSEISVLIKSLSKIPKENYLERLKNSNWKAILIKACDRLDNLRSLADCSTEFKRKQIEETKTKYYPLFDKLLTEAPPKLYSSAMYVRDEIRRVIERETVLLEIERKEK